METELSLNPAEFEPFFGATPASINQRPCHLRQSLNFDHLGCLEHRVSKHLRFIIVFGVVLCAACSTDTTRKRPPSSEEVALTVPQALQIPDSKGLRAKVLERVTRNLVGDRGL